MNKYRAICGTFLLLFVVVSMHFMAGSVVSQSPDAEWTLMFYMDADNDLEGSQMQDLVEMMAVGSTPNVNIVILADRSVKGENDDEDDTKYSNRPVGGLPNWTTAKLLVVEKGRLRQLADWGEVNMGDPANLTRFVKTVSEQFPAKRFGLVFGDHGEGWAGIVHDESADEDSLNMVELQTAFKASTPPAGKFELIGFDACLMANFEAAKAISPFGKTMVGSEELEPGSGWHYTPLLTRLNQNAAIDGFALGRIIVDTYRDFYLDTSQGERDQTVTLAVIDLCKIPALETAVNDLGTRGRAFMRSKGRTTWLKTADARGDTETYGGDEEFFDVVDFAQKTKLQNPDPDTVRSADAVIAATRSAVVYKTNGTARPQSSGMSIYFPESKEPVLEKSYNLTPFSVTGKWFPFIGEFYGLQIEDHQPPKLDPPKTTDAQISDADVATVSAQVSADDLAEATFILAESDGNRQIIIGALPTEPDDKGLLHEEWDGTWFTIGNEDTEVICPVTDFEEIAGKQDVFLVEVPAQIRFSGGRTWRDITMYFVLDLSKDDPVGEFVYAFEFHRGQAREVLLEPGDAVRPVYLAVDANGDTEEVASADAADIIKIKRADGIAVGGADVAAGKYLIGFLVTDYSGNSDAEFVDVTVE